MKYLLDTHAWIWMFESSDELPPRVRSLLKDIRHAPLGVSAISPWEVAKKASAGKMRMSVPARDWIMKSTGNPGVQLVPLSPEVSWDANHLPGSFHRDPADQIIVATARLHELTLISCDEKLLTYSHVRSFWA